MARSVDSDERETSHFAVYPAMNLEFLMDVDRAEREREREREREAAGSCRRSPRRRFVPMTF